MTSDEEIKGFAGLASLVSNIDEVLSQTQAKPTAAKASGKAGNGSETKHRQPTQAPKAKAASHSPPASDGTVANAQKQPKSGASRENWFWGLIGVGVLILLFYAGTDEGGRSPARTTQPSSTTQSSDEPTRALSVELSKPPVGESNVLSLAQLRWCLREDIRIDALRPLTTTNTEVGRFNSIVSDYNSRCGSFRYRRGTLERATRDIEAIRENIAEAAYRDSTKVLGRTDGAANRQGQKESEGETFRPETSASTRQPSKTTSRGADAQARGCVYKNTMTDADYIDCGLTPPSSVSNPSPTGDESKGIAKSAQNTADSMTERLRICREHYNADRLTTGVGGTALECYQRVLEIDPENADAVAGLKQIADTYVLWARTAFQRKRLERSKSYLDRLEKVNPNHPVLEELREAIRESERASVPGSTQLDGGLASEIANPEPGKSRADNKGPSQANRTTSHARQSEPDLSRVAKIYYFRSFRPAGMLRKFPFTFEEHTIGRLGVRQYLFFYTYPQVIRGPDNCQLSAQAGETYYLQFHLKADLSAWRCKLLEPRKAAELLDSFSESEEFRPMTVGAR